MILYQSRGVWYFLKIFQRRGSVFPFAVRLALPNALVAGLLMWLVRHGHILEDKSWFQNDSQLWGGFSFLVGLLITFRTSQSMSRFWDGCTSTHRMRAEWFDAASALVAFTRFPKDPPRQLTENFLNTLVRLFSMLHAAALAEIEDCSSSNIDEMQDEKQHEHEHKQAFKFELVDAMAIEPSALMAIRRSDCKPELLYQWIQCLVVDNIGNGVLSIPPPILSRSFQEVANGMVAFHDALRLSTIPFPFPYAQCCDYLLIMHWLVCPCAVLQWSSNIPSAMIFSFMQVFILWSMNSIAVEIENPFGQDANDLETGAMQKEFNRFLVMLLEPDARTTPGLVNPEELTRISDGIGSSSPTDLASSADGTLSGTASANRRVVSERRAVNRASFADVWDHLQDAECSKSFRQTEIIKESYRKADMMSQTRPQLEKQVTWYSLVTSTKSNKSKKSTKSVGAFSGKVDTDKTESQYSASSAVTYGSEVHSNRETKKIEGLRVSFDESFGPIGREATVSTNDEFSHGSDDCDASIMKASESRVEMDGTSAWEVEPAPAQIRTFPRIGGKPGFQLSVRGDEGTPPWIVDIDNGSSDDMCSSRTSGGPAYSVWASDVEVEVKDYE